MPPPKATAAPLEIRAYEPEDKAALTDIWYAASCISHPFLPAELLERQKQQVAEKYLPGTENWVACVNQKPVGFIGLIDDFIGGLFVSPAQQSCGIGTTLLDFAASIRKQLFLEVYAANHRACSFYRRNGFSGIKRREIDDNGLALPLIMMQRVPLSPRRLQH